MVEYESVCHEANISPDLGMTGTTLSMDSRAPIVGLMATKSKNYRSIGRVIDAVIACVHLIDTCFIHTLMSTYLSRAGEFSPTELHHLRT